MCKSCSHVSKLRIKSWKRNPRYIDKYKDMILYYQNFEFVLVDMSLAMKNKSKRYMREQEYANANRALYWWG